MKQILKDIFSILTRKEKNRFIRLVLLDVMVSALDILFLVLLLLIINFYSQANHISPYNGFLQSLFEKFRLLPILLFFVLFSLKNIFAFIVLRMQSRFTYEVASRISKNKLLDYLHGNYTDYIQTDSAVYLRGISQQPLEFTNYVLKNVQQIISQLIMILFTIIPIVLYNATLFPLLLLILLPPVIIIGFIVRKKMNVVRISAKETGERSWQHLKEALAAFVESNVDGKNNFFANRYHKYQLKLNNFLAEQQTIQSLPIRFIEVFAILGLLVLITLNIYSNNTGGLSIITIGAFAMAAYKIIPGIVNILNSMGIVRTYAFTTSGIEKDKFIIDRKEEEDPIATIEFEKVSFSYGAESILNDFDLKIKKGDIVGITGISGKGKTTLVNLLLGFLTAANGKIIINGLQTTEADRNKYWNQIAYIKQQSFLIHDSILRNITLEENEYDRNKLEQVIKMTGVDELINKSENGIDTVITEEGKNFSGGQRQRIILARALYKDFNMIILDEPFNELDEAAEKTLLEHLKLFAASGKIVILVTHNKDGLAFCNRKIMME